jgi:hypothetical protein
MGRTEFCEPSSEGRHHLRFTLLGIYWFSAAALMGQSGISGQANVFLEDGGTWCNGAARVVQARVDVSGLSGLASEPAGLNGAVLHLQLGSAAQTWFARVLSGRVAEQWPFAMKCTDTSTVLASGMVQVVSWATGDTPEKNYLVATLVFSGPSSPSAGNLTILSSSSLASKWWDDGTANGDGPSSLEASIGPQLSITIPPWPGLTLEEACASWQSNDPGYDFGGFSGWVEVLDLVELVHCMPY